LGVALLCTCATSRNVLFFICSLSLSLGPLLGGCASESIGEVGRLSNRLRNERRASFGATVANGTSFSSISPRRWWIRGNSRGFEGTQRLAQAPRRTTLSTKSDVSSRACQTTPQGFKSRTPRFQIIEITNRFGLAQNIRHGSATTSASSERRSPCLLSNTTALD
jgi:hypothetical protein